MSFSTIRHAAVVTAVLMLSACSDSTAPAAAPTVARAQAIVGEWQRIVAGTPASDSLTVLVLGTDGAPMANANVEWSVPASAGTVSITKARTDARGLASTAFTAGTTAGTVFVTATVAGLSPITFSLEIAADAPFRLNAMSALSDTLMMNEAYAGGTVRVTDQYDNGLAGVLLVASLFAEGSEDAVQTAAVVTDDQGVAKSAFEMMPAPGEYRLVFSNESMTLTYRVTVMMPDPKK